MFVITHVPWTQNTKADSLARVVWIQPSYFTHMYTVFSFLRKVLAESFYVDDKNKLIFI